MNLPAIIELPVPVYRGDDTDFFTYTLKTNNVAINLSGFTWTGSWRAKVGDDAFLPLVIDASQAASGILHVAATKDVTAQMESKGIWDVQGVRNSDGLLQTYFRGTTIWSADVTHD